MKKLILAILLLIPTVAHADYNWVGTLSANGLRVLSQDWQQTKEFRSDRPDLYEVNPILGKHPSHGRIDKYFTAVTALYLLSSLELPKEYASAVSIAMILVEAGAVINNAKLGVYADKMDKRSCNVITFTFSY